ncbi:hypothetical protein ACLBR5_09605 [Escherichia coli]
MLERAIIDTPPVLVRDGGVIASGYNEELDEWRALADGATDYLERLEVRERERTGLDTLKVGSLCGARLLHSNQPWQSHGFPINYMRRQTLKNAERYIIPELKEYEDKVLTSKGKALALGIALRRVVRPAVAASGSVTERERAGGTRRAGEPGGTGLYPELHLPDLY